MTRLRNLIKNLTLALSSVAVALVLAEVGLRVFFPISFSMEVEYVPDGHIGVRPKPNKVYALQSGGSCTINNLGFRRVGETSYDKPPGVVRIVALGGSSTFSFHTDDENIWTAVLEQKLKRQYGDKIEVINAGVPGYSVFESKINYLYQIRPLRPDVVIVYHTWNDMKFFSPIEKGEHLRKGVFKQNKTKSLLRHFQFAWRVRNFLNDVVYPARRENRYSKPGHGAVEIKPGGLAHRWERQNYDDLATWLNNDGVVPVFASQAGLLSADNIDDPDIRSRIYTEYQNLTFEQTLEQWLAISEIIQTSAARNGALFVDVYSAVPKDLDLFRDHVHLTERGNSVVARVLFDGLTRDARVDSLLRAM